MRNSPSAPNADETRVRLLEAATEIFSDLGFQGATTRLICERAQANPAAVNYHFGDKLGLYTEVARLSLSQDVLQINGEQLLAMDPDAAFEAFISRFFLGLLNLDGKKLHMQVLRHELSQPTPALAPVIEQVFRPISQILCQIISRITGCRPESMDTILACQSIIAQMTQYMTVEPILRRLWTEWPEGAGTPEQIVAHITRFSRSGLLALQGGLKTAQPSSAGKPPSTRSGRARPSPSAGSAGATAKPRRRTQTR